MTTRGDLLIESSLRQIWGNNYQKFTTTYFPAHASFFAAKYMMMKPLPVYILGFRCSAYSKPFEIIFEIMDISIYEEKLSIELSAYSPQFLANRNTSAYQELNRLVEHINNDSRRDLDYEFIMNGINNKTGCRLSASTDKYDERSLVNLIRSFYDEAKFVFGEMTYGFKDYF